jgi:hypothetical protein
MRIKFELLYINHLNIVLISLIAVENSYKTIFSVHKCHGISHIITISKVLFTNGIIVNLIYRKGIFIIIVVVVVID